MFVPYAHLSTDPLPLSLLQDRVHATLRLVEPGGTVCEFALSKSFKFTDRVEAVHRVSVGSVFEVEYRGSTEEVRIGRRILVTDG